MPSISEYMDLVELVLGEFVKYFVLLLFAILAIRLWRRLPKLSGANKQKTLCLASVVSLAACAIGFVAMSHSLGLLYSAYGKRAFRGGNVNSALSLFHTSSSHWKNADALGHEGICLLMLDQSQQGMRLIEEAKAMRKGEQSFSEKHYEGLFYFFHEQPDKAFPLLQSSACELIYRWDAIKLLSAMLIERNDSSDAAKFMAPFATVEIKDCDHAYVIASLKLSEGKKSEAQALLDQFPSEKLGKFWKPRFEKLREKVLTGSQDARERQASRVRPSSGAATCETQAAVRISSDMTSPRLAAPDDGRTPLYL